MWLLTFIKVIVLVLVLQTQVLVLVLVLDTQVLVLVLVLVPKSLLTTLHICNGVETGVSDGSMNRGLLTYNRLYSSEMYRVICLAAAHLTAFLSKFVQVSCRRPQNNVSSFECRMRPANRVFETLEYGEYRVIALPQLQVSLLILKFDHKNCHFCSDLPFWL